MVLRREEETWGRKGGCVDMEKERGRVEQAGKGRRGVVRQEGRVTEGMGCWVGS